MQCLEIFDASFNMISDLIDLEMCSSIVKLNLRNNLIEKEENISFLSTLPELTWLNLNENPIQKSNEYKDLVIKYIPHLLSLDKDEQIIFSNNVNKIKDDNALNDNPVNKFNQNDNITNAKPGGKHKQITSNTQTNFFKSSKSSNPPLIGIKPDDEITNKSNFKFNNQFTNTGTKFFDNKGKIDSNNLMNTNKAVQGFRSMLKVKKGDEEIKQEEVILGDKQKSSSSTIRLIIRSY